MKITAYDIIEPFKNLIEAKELLDKILSYYDVYNGQFRKIPALHTGICSILRREIESGD